MFRLSTSSAFDEMVIDEPVRTEIEAFCTAHALPDLLDSDGYVTAEEQV